MVRIGSKKFTESVILGEMASGLAEHAGLAARHHRELGGSPVLFQALLAGEIDLYPEYTGTLRYEILAEEQLAGDSELRSALADRGLRVSAALGFDNTYALGMTEARAAALGISRTSDLVRHPELRLGFSEEFLHRSDGWPGLQGHYGLPQTFVRGLDHDLAYRGLAGGDLDVIDVYTTDAEIPYYGLRLLDDDRSYFPEYQAVFLYREDLQSTAPELVARVAELSGRIGAAAMASMNASAKLDRREEAAVARDFLRAELGLALRDPLATSRLQRVLARGREHLLLVAISLMAAIAVAVPLGVLAARRPRVGRWLLGGAGVLQTLPSLAVLVFMIPLLGIGAAPAIAALFLYSLLPILRNTCTGIVDVPADLIESAEALGLTPRARLRLVELPMASRAILAGIKTAAVINVGTATLGALVAAGGFGQPILTGIRRDSMELILEGAIPAALLALLVQGMFDWSESFLVPKGLRLTPPSGRGPDAERTAAR